MARKLHLLSVLVCLGAFFALAGTASAATIQVDSQTDDGIGCTLREAIGSADTNGNTGGCAGTGTYGDDTVTFASGATDINTESQLFIDPAAPGTLTIQGPAQVEAHNTGFRVLGVSNDAGSAANAVTISRLEISQGFLNTLNNLEAQGAGIHNLGNLTLNRVEIFQNAIDVTVSSGPRTAVARGGGIYNAGTLAVNDSFISDNDATSLVNGTGEDDAIAISQGGGIFNTGVLTVRRSLISNNALSASAVNAQVNNNGSSRGAGVQTSGGSSATTTLEGSTIAANTATNVGGGGGSDGGGASLLSDGVGAPALTVKGSTFAGNSAPFGANLDVPFGSTATLESSVLAEPVAPGGNCQASGALSSLGHNLADDSTCGLTGTGDLQGTPAGLEALAENGGPWPSRRPSPGSPLIDRGVAAGQTSDQRGLTRTVDYDTVNATGGDGTDTGAVEIQGATPTSTTPSSPNDDTSPEVIGSAEPGSTIHLFGDTSCATTEIGSGPEFDFAVPGITVGPLAPGTTTEIRTNATYGTATSPCSTTGVSYTVPALPAPPPGSGTIPGTSPAPTPPAAPKCKKGQKLKGGRCVKKKRKRKK